MKYVLLHGLGQTSSSWKKTTDMLDEGLDVSCPDLFSLLRDKEINYENLYQAFSEYCGISFEPISICGLSLGGILALQYGIENPDKVNSMVLIGTQFAMPVRLLKFQNIVFHLMPEGTFRKMGLEKKAAISLANSMMDLDFQKDLYKIRCPVLVICGKKDKNNLQASLRLKEQIRGAKLAVIKNAGHEVNIDNPGELGKILNTFFNTNAGGER